MERGGRRPDNPETTPAVAEVTDTVAPPAGPEGRFTHIHGLGLGLNKTANKEGAKAFLAWLATEEAALPTPRPAARRR